MSFLTIATHVVMTIQAQENGIHGFTSKCTVITLPVHIVFVLVKLTQVL
jgi:hypothetical protein